MGNQVVRTTIEVVGSHDMVTILRDILKCVGDSGSTRGYSQTGYTTLKSSDTILEHTLSRVGQSTIDITCIAKAETVGSVL